ncbi:MAG: hypothetical protein JW927_18830 [Deltaproteobacteria bacterium]|nr:hypothetical protein [Deltaproteobacteria bacterium]
MKTKYTFIAVLSVILLLPQMVIAGAEYFTQRQGSYSFYNNIASRGAQYIAFGDNVKTLADYFHNDIPLMKANKGFDLVVTLFGQYDDDYKKHPASYGLRGELRFDFQLFLKENGIDAKWTVEPPCWSLDINNTETGHGGMLKEGKEESLLTELFQVFPLVKEIAPGVRYFDCEARTCGTLVVFNPERPPMWLPVTVREVVTAKLEFYKADPENKGLYDFIKPLVDKMSEDELNAPACYGSDDGILKVNGKGDGLQMMRFNREYWDRTLPPSAVQFIVMRYSEFGHGNLNQDDQKDSEDEYFKNNGHLNYADLVENNLNIEELTQLIQKK